MRGGMSVSPWKRMMRFVNIKVRSRWMTAEMRRLQQLKPRYACPTSAAEANGKG